MNLQTYEALQTARRITVYAVVVCALAAASFVAATAIAFHAVALFFSIKGWQL